METKFDKKLNDQSKIMEIIVERLQGLVGRNINIKVEMTEKLNKIFPSQEQEERIICNEDPNDYCNKIAILLDVLERTTTGHEFNLMHLRQIV
jgi:hypothetical protein